MKKDSCHNKTSLYVPPPPFELLTKISAPKQLCIGFLFICCGLLLVFNHIIQGSFTEIYLIAHVPVKQPLRHVNKMAWFHKKS